MGSIGVWFVNPNVGNTQKRQREHGEGYQMSMQIKGKNHGRVISKLITTMKCSRSMENSHKVSLHEQQSSEEVRSAQTRSEGLTLHYFTLCRPSVHPRPSMY
jgi:hypothetical protein